MKKRKVVILGSTGSIGTSALKVARDLPDRMEVVGLAANRSTDVILAQIAEFRPLAVTLTDGESARKVRASLAPNHLPVMDGESGLEQIAQLPEADMVLIAIVGTAGLKPALAAIRAGKDIAVASKEILVIAGEIVMREAEKYGVKVLPVDSEHSAIWQCLDGKPVDSIKRLILTASGGPFRGKKRHELESVTVEQALKHPTWEMGKKITIDSSTMFNKGLEMIEARWLFGLPMPQVDVIVHPQSIIHSMVEYRDGSVIAQLSINDMCYPIQYAVVYPDRVPNSMHHLDLAKMKALTFEEPDTQTFISLRLAREAGNAGGTLPAVFNAANEVAVDYFLNKKIGYTKIWDCVEQCMAQHTVRTADDLETVSDADGWARREAEELCRKF